MLDKGEVLQISSMIAEAIVGKLREESYITDKEHTSHHVWIAAHIKKDEATTALLNKLTEHLLKWGMLGVVSGMFYGLVLLAKEALQK